MRGRGDAPARGGRRWLFGERAFLGVPPAPYHKGRDAFAFGGQLQTPRCRQRQLDEFTYDRSKPVTAQALFHRREHFAVIPRLAVHDTVRMQTDARKGGREQIAPSQTPEHRAFQACGDPRCEQHGDARVFARGTRLDDFMQAAEGQAMGREMLIEFGDTEAQHVAAHAGTALDALQPRAKFADGNR